MGGIVVNTTFAMAYGISQDCIFNGLYTWGCKESDRTEQLSLSISYVPGYDFVH